MKITITFDLEVSDQITKSQKMEIIHKIDECINQLKYAEIISKRSLIAFPFHSYGFSAKNALSLGLYPISKSDFLREYFNIPIEDGYSKAWKDNPIQMNKNKKIEF